MTPEAIGAALTDDFAREHPGCAMLSLTGESRNLRRPPARDVRQLIAAVWASGSARPPERIPGACVEGVAFAPLGEPRLLFVLPRSLPVETRARWRQRVERESVRASLGALGFRP